MPTRNANPTRPIDVVAYPEELERAEAELVARRRLKAGRPPIQQPADALPEDTVGVGLSRS